MRTESRYRSRLVLAATAALLTGGLYSAPARALPPGTLIAPFGEAANDDFGTCVSGVGDVNGDGFDDVIVGAYAFANRTGRAYVFYGGSAPDAVADLILTGEAAGDRFGESVSGAGDVNGDSYADMIVGASDNDAAGVDAGRAYVYYGGPHADAIADLTLTGEAAGDAFGIFVSGSGDVNGDGYDDVIVGAITNDAGGTDAGRAYVYFGGPAVDAVADLTLAGEAAGDFFGTSATGVGDVNGDGYADMMVAAFLNDAGGLNAGRAYVYFGGPGVDAVVDLTLTGEVAGDFFGISGAGVGDVNDDGYGDLIVGAYFNDAGGSSAGRAYVYYGGPGLDAVADLTMTGEAAGDQFGVSVSGAGDVNADGYNDMIVGAYWNDSGGGNAGCAYVYHGGPSVDAVDDLAFTGEAAGDAFGLSVSGVGDMNGDGYADVIVGAPGNDDAGSDAGKVYVICDSSAVVGVCPSEQLRLAFLRPWPNPARKTIWFALDLDQDARARVDLYDLAGRIVARVLPETWLSAGRTVRSCQPQGLAPGMYHMRACVGDRERVRRIVWLGG